MRRFEYKYFNSILIEDLTKLGDQGWELCEILNLEGNLHYFLKREVINLNELTEFCTQCFELGKDNLGHSQFEEWLIKNIK